MTSVPVIDKIAWIRLAAGRVLSTRSRDRDVWYLPGGKREPGETDLRTLVRELDEELTVEVGPASARRFGTFEAQARGHAAGMRVRMTCAHLRMSVKDPLRESKSLKGPFTDY